MTGTVRHRIGLLDTSVVIDLEQLDANVLPTLARISAVTMAELGIGLHTTTDPGERSLRAERLAKVEAVFEPLPFTTDAARRFTRMVGLVFASGRNPRPRRIDLMIAAVASIHQIPLYTRNPRDFRGLDSVLTITAV
jgi:predicted nucleic acid-binding protein